MADDVLVTDITGIFGPDAMKNLERELRWEVSSEKLGYYERLRKAKEADRLTVGDKKWVEGIGQRILDIDARTYFRWQQSHEGCWEDKQFIKEFYRDNPECRADRF